MTLITPAHLFKQISTLVEISEKSVQSPKRASEVLCQVSQLCLVPP